MSDKSIDKEKGTTENFTAVANDRYHFDASDLDRVQRRLKQRHVQMYVQQTLLYLSLTSLLAQDCGKFHFFGRLMLVTHRPCRLLEPLELACSLVPERHWAVLVLWGH
jgi:hypothetical protein